MFPGRLAATAALLWVCCPPASGQVKATDLKGNPVNNETLREKNKQRTETTAQVTLQGKEMTLRLPKNYAVTTLPNGARLLECLFDCGDKVLSQGWGLDVCPTIPECKAKLDEFQKAAAKTDEKKKDDESQRAAEEAARFHQENAAIMGMGWTECAGPKGSMSCADYQAKYGDPSGSLSKKSGAALGYGKGEDPFLIGDQPGASGGGREPGSDGAIEPMSAQNPVTGIAGSPVSKETLDAVAQAFAPLLLARGAFSAKPGFSSNLKPLYRDTEYLDRVDDALKASKRSPGKLFDGNAVENTTLRKTGPQTRLGIPGTPPDPGQEL